MKYSKLNAGGCEFILPYNIPYFKKYLVFEHVISFILDNEDCYPIEYRNELDFNLVKYDLSKLYDPYQK